MIYGFTGEYRFLSNFHPAKVTFGGVVYPTLEHAYVASKTKNKYLREVVLGKETPGAAKRFGRVLPLSEDWEEKKVALMRGLIHQKFLVEHLRDSLMDTVGEDLLEANRWGDTFWGVDYKSGHGENWLGRILMDERDSIAREREVVA